MAGTKSFFILCLWACLGVAQAAPDIQYWQSSNGARVYFVEAHELPMVDVQVVFDAGSARDGAHPGLALMTNGLLSEGAGELDSNAIAERFDSLGARFGLGAQRDSATLSLRSLVEPELLQPALETVATILQRPTFPRKALERERARTLVALRQQEESPAAIASKAFYAALYGAHPYAGQPIGTEASVKALSREQLQAFYARYYVARNAVVAVVGDLDRAGAEALVERLVGGLPAGEPAPALPPVAALGQARHVDKEYPSSQTHVLMGQPGVYRGDPDYFPLYVGNHILGGGGLISRISDEVREKRGLAYSAYSYFIPMRQAGPFQLGLQTKNDSAKEAITVLRQTLEKFVAQGPSAEELEASKKNITGGFALRVDSNKDIIGYLAMIGFYGLPLDYLERFIERVEAVSVEQVHDAFHRRVHPERMVTVTVGG